MTSSSYLIEFANRQQTLEVPEQKWTLLLHRILASTAIVEAEISVAIVDDEQMQALNRQYLEHDYPTDVLSFILDRDHGRLVGEIIVSADTAAHRAGEFGWSADAELTMYVLHGALHLVGYDDKDPADRAVMRQREDFFLQQLDLK